MRKIFFKAIVILAAVFIMPCVCANAETAALDDVPMFTDDFKSRNGSKKAYILCDHDLISDVYTLTYYNIRSSKQLYKSEERFFYDSAISEDGTTAFYSVNDSVYRYSYTTGKIKKIYTVQAEEYTSLGQISVYSSPDGEYCLFSYKYYTKDNTEKVFFRLWHDGKIVSDKVYNDYNSRFDVSVSNDGKAIYMDSSKLYSFSFDTGKKELFASVPSEKYIYHTKIFHDKGIYVMFGLISDTIEDNDDPDYNNYKEIYSGKLYEEPKLIYSGNIAPKNFIACTGDAFVFYDGEYVVRLDLESGKSKNIIKLSPKLLESNKLSSYFVCSDDLDSAAFVNYSKNKLVRLSVWDSEKNSYTLRRETDLNGTKKELIRRYSSNDLSVIEIRDESPGSGYKSYAAFFKEKKLVSAPEDIICIDRFGHVLCGNTRYTDGLLMLSPDGSVKEVFEGEREVFDHYINNGYYLLSIVDECDDQGYEILYITSCYYIDKNGDAVFVRKGTEIISVYDD
ncbi:MAG: hypothetical protein J1E40_03775 [Oscillospiraceae bacterium]|nr:hypothetical protein [Oscillospiraceae bacterium]